MSNYTNMRHTQIVFSRYLELAIVTKLVLVASNSLGFYRSSSSSSGLPPSLNMLRIQAGEQEKSEISSSSFVLGAMQCIRTIISACKQ